MAEIGQAFQPLGIQQANDYTGHGPMAGATMTGAYSYAQVEPVRAYYSGGQPAPPACRARGFARLMAQLGPPDLVDPSPGGIAIWSRSTLRKRQYGFLRRVEILDEQVPCGIPVRHKSNLYIYVSLKPSNEQLQNLLTMSPNFSYDRGKRLLVVRADTLDRAVAAAALATLYCQGRLSYFAIYYQNLLKTYFQRANNGKARKICYTVLHRASGGK
jgi:hypothetical protein